MTTHNLLVELFVEELPPKALKKLGESFAHTLVEQLRAQGLAAADAHVTAFASPRRLAAHVTGVAAQATDKAVQQKLMPVAVGLDAAGNATPALLKKLQALGADVSDPAAAVAALKRKGLVQVSSLTPSDVSHVLGLQANWSAPAAQMAAHGLPAQNAAPAPMASVAPAPETRSAASARRSG